jgi:hypothetical protein
MLLLLRERWAAAQYADGLLQCCCWTELGISENSGTHSDSILQSFDSACTSAVVHF